MLTANPSWKEPVIIEFMRHVYIWVFGYDCDRLKFISIWNCRGRRKIETRFGSLRGHKSETYNRKVRRAVYRLGKLNDKTETTALSLLYIQGRRRRRWRRTNWKPLLEQYPRHLPSFHRSPLASSTTKIRASHCSPPPSSYCCSAWCSAVMMTASGLVSSADDDRDHPTRLICCCRCCCENRIWMRCYWRWNPCSSDLAGQWSCGLGRTNRVGKHVYGPDSESVCVTLSLTPPSEQQHDRLLPWLAELRSCNEMGRCRLCESLWRHTRYSVCFQILSRARTRPMQQLWLEIDHRCSLWLSFSPQTWNGKGKEKNKAWVDGRRFFCTKGTWVVEWRIRGDICTGENKSC